MEVILTQDIQKVGKTGEVVKVKDGYARNMLFPQKLAYPATDANLKKIAHEAKKRAEINAAKRQEAQALADQLSKISCTISVEVNDLEKLYGSVTDVDIVKALKDEGFEIDRRDIVLDKPIEALGIFEAGVKLHPEVSAKIRVWVTKR